MQQLRSFSGGHHSRGNHYTIFHCLFRTKRWRGHPFFFFLLSRREGGGLFCFGPSRLRQAKEEQSGVSDPAPGPGIRCAEPETQGGGGLLNPTVFKQSTQSATISLIITQQFTTVSREKISGLDVQYAHYSVLLDAMEDLYDVYYTISSSHYTVYGVYHTISGVYHTISGVYYTIYNVRGSKSAGWTCIARTTATCSTL